MAVAIYAGTFDPITFGHLSVLRQALRVFTHVRLLIAADSNAPAFLGTSERVELLDLVVGAMPNVSVDATNLLVVEYARSIGASFLVRGLRPGSDAAFEGDLAQVNRELAPEIVSVFFAVEPHLAVMSASAVKEMWRRGEMLDNVCPRAVIRALESKREPSSTPPVATRSHIPIGTAEPRPPSDRPPPPPARTPAITLRLGKEEAATATAGPRQGTPERSTQEMEKFELPFGSVPPAPEMYSQRRTLPIGPDELDDIEAEARLTVPSAFDAGDRATLPPDVAGSKHEND
jgi:pantetheine-phosphate adenylyltransferase